MIDGQTQIGDFIVAAANGIYPDVPIMLGANSADGFPMGDDKDQIFSSFGEYEAEARSLYDPDGDKTALEVGVQVSADIAFREPGRAIARVLAGNGHDVWVYRFQHNGSTSGQAMGGLPHAGEIPYVFDVEEVRRQQVDTGFDAQVADIAHAYWVNFARTGNPNGNGPDGKPLPEWPAASPDTTMVMSIDSPETAYIEDPLTAQLDLRERITEGNQ